MDIQEMERKRDQLTNRIKKAKRAESEKTVSKEHGSSLY